MGFVLQKVVLSLILPPSGLLLLILAGLILVRRHRTAGRALLASGVILLFVLSLEPVADRLIRPLEAFSPPFSAADARPDAVVVLGGGVHELNWVPVSAELSGQSLTRLVSGIRLAKAFRVPLVMAGGSGRIYPGSTPEAVAMADMAEGLGFPRKEMVVEDRSRNTWENAEKVREAIKGRNVVLVTSAFHMKRASGMFRKQGFAVLPAPAGYFAQMLPFSYYQLIPKADALMQSSIALSEYLSLAWYWTFGKL